ncbi:SMI1/KNR4 family protein [Streptomyces sp. NPDC057236]|uniref:SMI1/KNR4 family protein n=1 Tax=Streptomyces sp. NPDC057236 TaxID=3346059 RepID=UPI003642EC5D
MNTTTVHRRSVVLTALTTATTAACGGRRQRSDAPARHASSEGPGADPREDVAHQWGRLTSWLRRHAPATHARLRPPVTPEALAWYEKRIGTPLHDDLKTLWGTNEGTYLFGFPGFLDGDAPLSIDGSFLCHPLERARERGWERTWVPFACNDPTDPYSGLFHDAETGRVGYWTEAEPPQVWKDTTLAGCLSEQADALYEAAPRPHGGDVPGVWNGLLVRDDPGHRLYHDLDGWRPVHEEHRGHEGDA